MRCACPTATQPQKCCNKTNKQTNKQIPWRQPIYISFTERTWPIRNILRRSCLGQNAIKGQVSIAKTVHAPSNGLPRNTKEKTAESFSFLASLLQNVFSAESKGVAELITGPELGALGPKSPPWRHGPPDLFSS